ncbi:unnamed protein product [Brassica oleracea var. botrytis]
MISERGVRWNTAAITGTRDETAITGTRDETATSIQKNNHVGACGIGPASDQPIRPTVDMSASKAPRVFPSHGVTESIIKARHGLLCHRIRPLTWIRLQQASQSHPCGTNRLFPYEYA